MMRTLFHGGFRPGDTVVTMRDTARTPWPKPGEDNVLPRGTRAVIRRLSTVASDMVRIQVGDDTAEDSWIAVNVRDLRKVLL
jgi:hypothetical protein